VFRKEESRAFFDRERESCSPDHAISCCVETRAVRTGRADVLTDSAACSGPCAWAWPNLPVFRCRRQDWIAIRRAVCKNVLYFNGKALFPACGRRDLQLFSRARRIAAGNSKLEAIRCLKRYIAREVFGIIMRRHREINQSKIAA
jgi:hypothetical protein